MEAASTALGDMESPPGSPREDTTSHSLGVDEFPGERQDAKPAVISVTGGEVEKDLRSEPEQGAAAEGEESHGGAGAPGPVDEGAGGGEESPQQQQQQQEEAHAATEGPQPQDRQQRLRHLFARLDLKELESVFQRTRYPDVFVRKELSICMDVTQAKAQVSKLEKSNVAGQPF